MKLNLLSGWGVSTLTDSSAVVQSTAASDPAALPFAGSCDFRQQRYCYTLQAAKLFVFSILLSMGCILSASAQNTGALMGSSTAVTAFQTVDLSSLGTSDWAHWGLNGARSQTPGQFDHKMASSTAPVGLISNYTAVGSGDVYSWPHCYVNSTWTPINSAPVSTASEVYTSNNGHGFSLSVPADTTSRTFTVYVGGFNNHAKLTAHLSDGSTADFIDTSYGYNKPGNINGHNYQAAYTLTYHAASAGQKLTVSWIQTSCAFGYGNVNLQGAALAVNPSVFAAPTGLTATPQWTTSCPVCNGMAMAHIILAWNAVAGATSYTVYRGGTPVQTGLTTSTWTDMTVTSGTSYTYAVTAAGDGSESPLSAFATAIAPSNPSPQVSTVVTAPVNLCVTGIWQNDPTDTLTWTPVPGAVSYNIYQYGVLIAGSIKATSYTLPVNLWTDGETYTVTALDSMGMETLPSAPATAQGRFDPTQSPSWILGAPIVPTNLAATAEWNAGMPRIHLAWRGDSGDYTYAVYRDGNKVAEGIWGLNYIDVNVKPGETHTYAVTGGNLPWSTFVESALSQTASATALTAVPAPALTLVQITGVKANDDSAVISFAAVPGAVDYRVYSTAKPNTVKYSGGGLSIEMNGLDPVNGADLVVEAVDKFGPFQTMDGMAGPGAMQMDGVHSAINGQGDPSNIPNVLATSAPVHVTLTPVTLTGDQAFFDNFRDEQPVVAQPLPTTRAGSFYGDPQEYSEVANDKWAIRDYGGDRADTKVFFMSNHFMDTLYDGGQPHSSIGMHNNNASLVMMPKTTADISGGKVLHTTFEVDAHFGCNSRRWCDLQIAAAGDLLIEPGKVQPGDGTIHPATQSGCELRWEIQGQFHSLFLYTNSGTPTAPLIKRTDMIDLNYDPNSDRYGPAARVAWDGTPQNNGTEQDLDKRHKFDLYLSQSHVRILENGQVIKDTDLPQLLPFSKCQVYFVHQLYHTGNDRPELVNYYSQETYSYNYRPWADERHWDNMGQEVLPSFPAK